MSGFGAKVKKNEKDHTCLSLIDKIDRKNIYHGTTIRQLAKVMESYNLIKIKC